MKNKMILKNSAAAFLCSTLFLGGCFFLPPSPEKVPKYSEIAVEDVVMETNGTKASVKKTPFEVQLEEIATKKIVTLVSEQRIGSVASRKSAVGGKADSVILKTVVSIPLFSSLHDDRPTTTAKEGNFATIHMRLYRGSELLAKAQEKLEWNDVRWTTGGHKTRRRKPIESVFEATIEALTELGVYKLQKILNQPNG